MHHHETAVAKLCARFLSEIHPELAAWGELLGKWHDIGKYSKEFQEYICAAGDPEATSESRSGRVNHSTAGAKLAIGSLEKGLGDLAAYVIAGHHAGLADRVSGTGEKRSGLDERLKEDVPDWREFVPAELLTPLHVSLPIDQLCRTDARRCGFQLSFICRMLFSALCDADFLATEAFMAKSVAKERGKKREFELSDLKRELDVYLRQFATTRPSEVNKCRAEVLEAVQAASSEPPGFFSLTVPTGGGKTLASLSFALNHATNCRKRRVIYAIPFTSIIEQAVDQFRSVFSRLGNEVVLEHHSNTDPDQESRLARLTSQNWDAPLIVTTNVQLFESLFANRTSRCRKLHRIANSVIVLDEVQSLPVELLEPCLAALRELVDLLGCTVLFCTATQPAIRFRKDFPIGVRNAREIVPDPRGLYSRMKRVRVTQLGMTNDHDIAVRVSQSDQALCIVNTRSHAFALFEAVDEYTSSSGDSAGVFHLSTCMCAAHRSATIRTIRKRLHEDLPCRVISTQLIEAGVDIDFPVVLRAMTGVDSIAQAAGRCNREGRLDKGSLYIFEPEGRKLIGYLRSTAETAKEIAPLYDDMLSLEAVEHYFKLHYWNKKDQWDAKEIMPLFADARNLTFQFKTASERFRFIEDTSRSLFVPWGKIGRLLEAQLRSRDFATDASVRRAMLRKAQRFMVPVYENVFSSLVDSDVEMIDDSVAILANQSMYSERLGLDLSKAGYIEPESAIC